MRTSSYAHPLLIAVLAIATLNLCGCASVGSIRYDSAVRPPKPAGFSVEIIDAVDLKRPYKVIGQVQIDVGALQSTSGAIEKLKNEARKMGGDALIDLKKEPIGAAVPYGGSILYTSHARDLWTAKVIVWQGSDVQHPPEQ